MTTAEIIGLILAVLFGFLSAYQDFKAFVQSKNTQTISIVWYWPCFLFHAVNGGVAGLIFLWATFDPDGFASSAVELVGAQNPIFKGLAIGLAVSVLLRATITSIKVAGEAKETPVGLVTLYDGLRLEVLQALLNKTDARKDQIIRKYSGRFTGVANFPNLLRKKVENLIVYRDENYKELVKQQFDTISSNLGPKPNQNLSNENLDYYYDNLIHIALDYGGIKAVDDFLNSQLSPAAQVRDNA